jgi:hypothetical protein
MQDSTAMAPVGLLVALDRQPGASRARRIAADVCEREARLDRDQRLGASRQRC